MKTSDKRLFAVVTTVLAGLLMVQSPASAFTHKLHITSGTLTLVKTGVTTLLFDLGPTGACPPSTWEADISHTSISVTAVPTSFTWVVGGVTYVFVWTLSPATAQVPGTVVGSSTGPHNFTSLRVGIRMTLFAVATGTTCTPTGTTICTLQATPHFAGTLTSVSTSNLVTLVLLLRRLRPQGHVAFPFQLTSGALGASVLSASTNLREGVFDDVEQSVGSDGGGVPTGATTAWATTETISK